MVKYFKIFGINLTVLLFLLALTEIFLRFYYNFNSNYNVEMWRYGVNLKSATENPKLPFVHRKNASGNFYGVNISTNKFGFRDNNNYDIQRKENRKRVMVIGDSFSLGWGVPHNQIFSEKLRQKLGKTFQDIEVINTGVGNYNSVMQTEFYKTKGIEFKPDLVILMYYINDAEPTPKLLTFAEMALKTNFYLYSLFFNIWLTTATSFNQNFSWENYYSNLYSKNSSSLAATEATLRDLIKTLKKNKVDIIFANIPELRELKNYKFRIASDFIKNIAVSHNVEFVDFHNYLINHDPETLWFSKEDPHANAKAFDIMSDVIAIKILKTKLLKKQEK